MKQAWSTDETRTGQPRIPLGALAETRPGNPKTRDEEAESEPQSGDAPHGSALFYAPPAILTEFPTSVKSETIIFVIMNKTSA